MLPNPLSNSEQRVINQYRIVSLLGRGGMGEVWRAEDTRLKRQVALKLLPNEFTNDTERLRRFEQEALAISALNHPNIITIHEIGESDAGRFIVMELVAGRTLRAIAAEPVAIDSLIAWGSQLAKALHAAHAAGVTHRDIKPENIMVRADGYVKVLDFGLARLSPLRNAERGTRNEEAEALAGTQPGMLLGTVNYMSPEQARGETVSHPSDIFALGILFYELATGVHPFRSATLLGILQQITTETPVAPAQLNPALPATLNALILRMLAKQAEARPTAGEIEQALAELASPHSSGQIQRAVKPASERHTVGRATERAELQSGFASALDGRGQLLCVAGEPGIGKTTLVEDFLAELTTRNQCTIARGRCSERLAGTEAYLPLLEALESLLQNDKRLAQTMKQLAPTWYAQVAPLSGDTAESARLLAEVKAASQERMKRELASFLQAVAQQQPLVIFFDDLHWADVSTIDLLSFLAGKFDAMRVLIVVTYRPSDLLLAKHPFLQIKPDLQARGVCRELLLEFLTAAEIAEYLALEFPGNRFPPEFPQLIHAKTEGSPLFMADLVRYLRDRSVIANTSGAWILAQTLPDIERELPESVRGMIERKIAQLSEDDRKLLTAASVQGYEFDSAVVAQVLSLDADEVEERLEKLERVFAFVKLTSEAEFPNRTLTLKYRFVHVLYQNALYGSLRATRRATLSASVAQSLLGFYGERSSSIAAELAHLLEAARDFARSVEFYLLAAQQASDVLANAEAIVLAQCGLQLLKSLPDNPQRVQKELALELTQGMALGVTRGYAAPETGASYARARELCQLIGEAPEVFPVLWGLWAFYMVGGEQETSRQIGEQMVQVAQTLNEKVMLAAAHQALGFTLVHMGEVILARENLEQSICFHDPNQHQTYIALLRLDPGIYSLGQLPRILWLLGYPDQGRRKLQEAFSLSEKTGDSRSLAMTQMFATVFHTSVREYVQVQNAAETCIAHCNEHDIAQERAWATAWDGNAIAAQGATERGISMLRDTIALLQEMGAKCAFTEFHAMLAQWLGEAGKTEEALATLTEAIQISPRMGESYFNAEIQRIRGELLLKTDAVGREAEAEACYHQAIGIARQQSAKSWELRAATSLARLWQRQRKTAEARQMLAEIYGWFTEGFDTADLKEAQALLAELDHWFSESVSSLDSRQG